MSTAAQVPLLANLATSFYLSNAAERHLCERQTNEPIVVTDFGGGGAISVKNVEFSFLQIAPNWTFCFRQVYIE